MILSENVIGLQDLRYKKDDKCILHQKHNFIGVEQVYIKNYMDSSYLIFDTKRNIYIRVGTAEVGMKIIWKEHVSTSLRNSPFKSE